MNPPGSNPTNPNRSYLENNIISPDSSMVTYGSYLKVQDLLSLQTRLSQPPEHDEMLFIIIHQSYELWFKQILHEMDLADFDLCQDNPFGALKTLKRITTIMRTLTDQVSILETMTPNDFNRFRDRLNPASGFQSWQFRLVEYRMGLKDDAFLKFFRTQPHAVQAMESAKSKPSFYDQVLRFLSRKGFEVPNDVLNRNVEEFYESNEGVEKTFIKIYENSHQYSDVYNMLESLVDLDQQFTLWRYRHVAMVERMIGSRIGTGGSSGVKYLSATLAKRFFPELWNLRSKLGSGTYGVGSDK